MGPQSRDRCPVNAQDHIAEAERLLAATGAATEVTARNIARAQVHATLALALKRTTIDELMPMRYLTHDPRTLLDAAG